MLQCVDSPCESDTPRASGRVDCPLRTKRNTKKKYKTKAQSLGLTIDPNLRFEAYVREIVRHRFYRLKVLYRIRSYPNVNLRIRLVESIVLPKLNYCDTVYGPRLRASSKTLIQRVQNACSKFYFDVPS
ncbi:hypothetical protein EVAR_52709_1 [Eumeta japonica]|uniref:Uncharacterized protein n=1 Tax=Eumeta variegata TaxID=151549 RepID=A0A4C1Y0K7_EUMVA|nr:hypothetical protein EVAR_52709_1 [Eumeta japonica]